jgi:ammonia channel protein AmtB
VLLGLVVILSVYFVVSRTNLLVVGFVMWLGVKMGLVALTCACDYINEILSLIHHSIIVVTADP